MKLLLSIVVLAIFIASPSFSADFSPTQLKVSVPDAVHYDFDGSSIDIPLTISGTAGAGFLIINTKDQAGNMGIVQNGHLGWHYINGIDTCVYASSLNEFSLGTNAITWDGKDNDGGAVPAGDYTYYIWAYDHINSKTVVSSQMTGVSAWNRITLLTHDTDGTPLANPPIYLGTQRHLYNGVIDDDGNVNAVPGINQKWIIGTDPHDETLLETCQTYDYGTSGGLEFHPTDHSMFFIDNMFDYASKVTMKWEWIPNGDAILETDWGEDGIFEYASNVGAGWSQYLNCSSDGGDYLIVGDGEYSGATEEVRLFYVDINEGTEIKRLDISEWWVRYEEGGQASLGPTTLEIRNDKMYLNSFVSVMSYSVPTYSPISQINISIFYCCSCHFIFSLSSQVPSQTFHSNRILIYSHPPH